MEERAEYIEEQKEKNMIAQCAHRGASKPKEERENLGDDVAEIEAYNKRHGASLSYGKWRAMVEGRT